MTCHKNKCPFAEKPLCLERGIYVAKNEDVGFLN